MVATEGRLPLLAEMVAVAVPVEEIAVELVEQTEATE